MISSDECTCAGKVTDVRVEDSLLGLRTTIPFLGYCTTLHHVGANPKWKSEQYLFRRFRGQWANMSRFDQPASLSP